MLDRGLEKHTIELFSFSLLPSHCCLVLDPQEDGPIGSLMRWVTATHSFRYHAHDRAHDHTWGRAPLPFAFRVDCDRVRIQFCGNSDQSGPMASECPNNRLRDSSSALFGEQLGLIPLQGFQFDAWHSKGSHEHTSVAVRRLVASEDSVPPWSDRSGSDRRVIASSARVTTALPCRTSPRSRSSTYIF